MFDLICSMVNIISNEPLCNVRWAVPDARGAP